MTKVEKVQRLLLRGSRTRKEIIFFIYNNREYDPVEDKDWPYSSYRGCYGDALQAWTNNGYVRSENGTYHITAAGKASPKWYARRELTLQEKHDRLVEQNANLRDRLLSLEQERFKIKWQRPPLPEGSEWHPEWLILKGESIIGVRTMTPDEMEQFLWDTPGTILMLTGGKQLLLSADDEGNRPGAGFIFHEKTKRLDTLYVMYS